MPNEEKYAIRTPKLWEYLVPFAGTLSYLFTAVDKEFVKKRQKPFGLEDLASYTFWSTSVFAASGIEIKLLSAAVGE